MDDLDDFQLTFHNVKYSVWTKNPHQKKRFLNCCSKKYWKPILSEVNGYARSGETTFIMGSSGAGKTSLLNVLCDRIKKRGLGVKYSGDVKLNSYMPVTSKNFGNYGAYVMQDDNLFPTMTAEECLMFAALLKLNKSWKVCKERVNELIEELRLKKC